MNSDREIIKALREEIAKLKKENEILKKKIEDIRGYHATRRVL